LLSIEKYAAIDIGSNAIRLLIVSVIEKQDRIKPIFKKTSLIRVPIRLGADVFLNGKISEASYLRMLDAMNAFQLLIKTHNVVKVRACATSAMREARNGKDLVKKIRKETGLQIQIIDGKDEAALIASTDLKDLIEDNKNFLYVDVGGGSTEFTVFSNGKTMASKSFNIGTIRILNDKVDESHWSDVKKWIKNNTTNFGGIELIGSGGNINSIYKNSGQTIGKSLSYFYLSNLYRKLASYTYQERIYDLEMNSDRADVIVPALKIYLTAMKCANARNIYVPKIGLTDGIIKSLYNEKLAMNMTVR
jgi:exopolyphosphatase/guanosine-5'-triphosphate,3'-diphosphate pyrophosphatase